MLLDTELSPLQTDYVETIKNSSHELLVVINDVRRSLYRLCTRPKLMKSVPIDS